MSLADKIKINTSYTRSINLERDADSSAIVSSYIPTSRAIQVLKRVTDSFGSINTPRSWALIGPYGSGKSAFGVFLSHLIGDSSDEVTHQALNILVKEEKDAEADLTEAFAGEIDGTKGYLPILITGSPEPLGRKIVHSMAEAAEKFWQSVSGKKPSIIEKLNRAASNEGLSTSEIEKLVVELQAAVGRSKGRGILLVIDELGKFLEYEARHYGANDIYLLQALAERAYKGGDSNLCLVVLMHQAFDQYARGLGENLRNEWAKVQGRFENIPFLESTEQVLKVVANAIDQQVTNNALATIKKACREITDTFVAQKALPSVLGKRAAVQLFADCYPLHPVSALLLPLLCQKVAQNERTLFSYLGSKEPHGFQDSLRRISKIGDWVYPWEIYDYFIVNQSAMLSDPMTHRRWAEVVTAIERLGDAPEDEVNLLKTIGLLNIIGGQGGFKASKILVHLCLPSKAQAADSARSLIGKSVLQFRKYSGEYRIWQGSDFDLESAVQDELSQLGDFDLPEALNSRKALPPVVARRYTIDTGTLRYFTPYFIKPSTSIDDLEKSNNLRLILCVSENQGDVELFNKKIKPNIAEKDVVALCHNGDQLREAVAEVLALQRVHANRYELNSDPVAQREFKDRLAVAEKLEDELLSDFISSPERSKWYWKGQEIKVENKRDLQIQLSQILTKVFTKSPRIKNELINREKPSSQAIGARNKLLFALLNHSDQENLAIEKTPAEKGVYMAIFKATGLHRQIDGQWQLAPPEEHNDKHNLYPVWKEIESFLECSEEGPKSYSDLNEKLMSPPYGVKAGLLPILYIASYLCYQYELALYEDGAYIPLVTAKHLERFLRRPSSYKVQRFRIEGLRASIFESYSEIVQSKKEQKQTVLSIAKPIAQFMTGLPEYAKKTERISKKAIKVRRAYFSAKSPEKLLFEDLPKACGYMAIDPKEHDDYSVLEGFSISLRGALKELNDAYSALRETLKNNIANVLLGQGELTFAELRRSLGRFDGLDNFTVDVKGLRAFLRCLGDRSGDDEAWFDNVLLFLGDRASKKWNDLNFDSADLKLSEYARRIKDLELLRAHHDHNKDKREGDFEVILLRTLRQGMTENDHLVCIDDDLKNKISDPKARIKEILSDDIDEKLKLAILADLVDELLTANKQQDTERKDELNEVG